MSDQYVPRYFFRLHPHYDIIRQGVHPSEDRGYKTFAEAKSRLIFWIGQEIDRLAAVKCALPSMKESDVKDA